MKEGYDSAYAKTKGDRGERLLSDFAKSDHFLIN
jgi:hypothetical protein